MSKKLETLAMGICTTVALSAAGAALYKMLEKENQDENKMSEWLIVTARPGKYSYTIPGKEYDFSNPDEDKVSASQSKPDKKEPPKNSINKDAFINAVLESRNGGRAGKK